MLRAFADPPSVPQKAGGVRQRQKRLSGMDFRHISQENRECSNLLHSMNKVGGSAKPLAKPLTCL
jgi:hypothetical protein